MATFNSYRRILSDGLRPSNHLLKFIPESKGWKEKIKLAWEERRNPANDDFSISRRRSWAGEGLTSEALAQVKKEAEEGTSNLLFRAADKKAYRDKLGARERVDSALSFNEIVQDFASRTSRSRASSLESTDDASTTVILSNEERWMKIFPTLCIKFFDDTINEETNNDELISSQDEPSYSRTPCDKLYKDRKIIYDEINNHDNLCKTETIPSESEQELPNLSRRISCPALFLGTPWDRHTLYASDSFSQYDFSTTNLPDDASAYSHITSCDSFYALELLRETKDEVREKILRCCERGRWKKEKAKVEARIKLEKKWLRGRMGKERLRTRWEEYEVRMREREVELREKGHAWKERRKEGFWGRMKKLCRRKDDSEEGSGFRCNDCDADIEVCVCYDSDAS